MSRPSLLLISMGELATHLLEAVARTDVFDTIVVASRDLEKAKKRTNNAVLGAGIEGFFPRIVAEKLDVHSNDFSTRLREIKPDFIFSAPSLLPWWKLAPDGIDIPLQPCIYHLCRNLETELHNLVSTPFGLEHLFQIKNDGGPDYGIGNVQEPIAKIQIGIGQELNCKGC